MDKCILNRFSLLGSHLDLYHSCLTALLPEIAVCSLWFSLPADLGSPTVKQHVVSVLSPRLCFFIVLHRDLFVYTDDSLTRGL